MKTIRQIADEIGVSKQTVYKRYKGKLHTVCAPYAHTVQGVLYLSEQAETLIKQDFLQMTAPMERIRSAPLEQYRSSHKKLASWRSYRPPLTRCRGSSP